MASHPVKQEPLAVPASSRKRQAAQLFAQVAVTVSDGEGYGLRDLVRAPVSLAQARAAWKPMASSLAAVVLDEREHV